MKKCKVLHPVWWRSPDPDPHINWMAWIRIRIETSADPKRWKIRKWDFWDVLSTGKIWRQGPDPWPLTADSWQTCRPWRTESWRSRRRSSVSWRQSSPIFPDLTTSRASSQSGVVSPKLANLHRAFSSFSIVFRRYSGSLCHSNQDFYGGQYLSLLLFRGFWSGSGTEIIPNWWIQWPKWSILTWLENIRNI